MKSLNLCSRLPNLFEITHLQKRKINWTFQEEKEMLTPVNAFICLGALLNTEEDRPGQLDMSSDQDPCLICNWYQYFLTLTRSFHPSKTYIGRSQKGPSRLGCLPEHHPSWHRQQQQQQQQQPRWWISNDFYPKPLGSGGGVTKHLKLHIGVLVLICQELVLELLQTFHHCVMCMICI